jgi:hypothetical protein
MNLRYGVPILALTLIVVGYQSSDSGGRRKSKTKTYQFRNDTLVQTIVVKWQSANRIGFQYSVKNTRRHKTIKITGIANNPHPEMDPEIDEDEPSDLVYPSTRYIFEQNGCYLAIQIELNKKDRVVVTSGECPRYLNQWCPLNSQGVLKIKK